MSQFVIVRELQALVSENSEIKTLLLSSIMGAEVPSIRGLLEYYNYLDGFVCWLPINKDRKTFDNKLAQFFWFLAHPSGMVLQNNLIFSHWLLKFFQIWGEFLESPESSIDLDRLVNNTRFALSDYECPHNNWKSFNQFMSRNIISSKRPIAKSCDDQVISFPSDGIFKGSQNLTNISTISMGHIKLCVFDVLANSAYKEHFRGGFFHIYY